MSLSDLIAYLNIVIIIIPFFLFIKNRKIVWLNIVIFTIGIVLMCLTCKKSHKDLAVENDNKRKDSIKSVKIDSLLGTTNRLTLDRKKDSASNKQFEDSLYSIFHIIRDSKNQPKLYNIHINKVRDVIFN